MSKNIHISIQGLYHNYESSFLPALIRSLGYKIEWVDASKADLVIYGPFFNAKDRNRWVPRPLRPLFNGDLHCFLKKERRALTLFHTSENIRYDQLATDYSLSFDYILGIEHFRLPLWMEVLDWTCEGLKDVTNPRFGKLIEINRLMQPLGSSFLSKPRRVAFFSSHLREPRSSLLKALSKVIPVDGMGPYFDHSIVDHNQSNFSKFTRLKNYGFNLCPENSLYPGYCTEKIPEAFAAGTLPISWVDVNVRHDFNPEAFINLYPYTEEQFTTPLSWLTDEKCLNAYAEQPLLLNKPSIEGLKVFMLEVLRKAKS